MSDHTERFAAIEGAFLDALSNYHADMARTRTPAQALDVDTNFQSLERIYNAALTKTLTAQTPLAEETLAQLRTANLAVEALRQQTAAIALMTLAIGDVVGMAARLLAVAAG